MASLDDVVRSIDAMRAEDRTLLTLITALTDRVSALEKATYAAPSTRASSLTLTNTEVSSDEEEGGIAVNSMSLIPQPKKPLKRCSNTPTLIAKREELARLKRLNHEKRMSLQPKPSLCADDLKTQLKPIRDEISLLTGCMFGIERRLKSLTEEAGSEPFFKAANGVAVKSLATKYEGFKMPTLKSPPKNLFTNTLSMPSSSASTTTTMSTTITSTDTKTNSPLKAENPIFRLSSAEGFKPKALTSEKAIFTSTTSQLPTAPPLTTTPTTTLPPSHLPKPTIRPTSSTHTTPPTHPKRPLSLSLHGSSSTPRRPSTLRNITNTSTASTIYTPSSNSPFTIPEAPRSVIFGQPSTPSLPPKYAFDFNVEKSPFGGYAKPDAEGDESPFGKLPKSAGNPKKRMSLGYGDGRTGAKKGGAGNGNGKMHHRVSWLDTAMLNVSLVSVPKSDGVAIQRASQSPGAGTASNSAGPTWPTVFAPKEGPGAMVKGQANGKEKENEAKRRRGGSEGARERSGNAGNAGNLGLARERENRHSVA